jgi:hypothetical protein
MTGQHFRLQQVTRVLRDEDQLRARLADLASFCTCCGKRSVAMRLAASISELRRDGWELERSPESGVSHAFEDCTPPSTTGRERT